MWFLLGTTLTASFFDSLNPSAIAQQMLLQAMVKKKRQNLFSSLYSTFLKSGICIFHKSHTHTIIGTPTVRGKSIIKCCCLLNHIIKLFF